MSSRPGRKGIIASLQETYFRIQTLQPRNDSLVYPKSLQLAFQHIFLLFGLQFLPSTEVSYLAVCYLTRQADGSVLHIKICITFIWREFAHVTVSSSKNTIQI